MPSVTVSDLRAAGRDAARIRATHALSLLDPDGTPAPDLGLPPERHLVLRFLDIDDEGFGARRGPDLPIVEAILRFASDIPETGAVLVHCHAGVSRSPAAALLMLSEWGAPLDLPGYAGLPNERLLRLAGDLTGRDLVAAGETIGRRTAAALLASDDWPNLADAADEARRRTDRADRRVRNPSS